MNIKQSVFFFFLLGLLACSSWYFASSPQLKKLDKDTLSTTPDIFVQNLTVRKFDENGLLTNQLKSPFMKHFPKDNSHIFTNPHILVHQKDEPPWDIRSLHAKSIHAGEQITFTKEVVVHQAPGTKTQESTLKTEKIVYYPKEQKATSDLLVTFEQPGNKVQSQGMTAYLAEKRVQLLNQARGHYVPKTG